jgi:hypothetical protein
MLLAICDATPSVKGIQEKKWHLKGKNKIKQNYNKQLN